MKKDDHFLSAENPLATVDQREAEDLALRLLQRPELQKARMIATMLWRNVAVWPARDQMSRFDNMINEYMFHYAIRAASNDAGYPKVVRFMPPPHHWFGRDVPGSRWGGDSPDFVYRLIPIEHGGRYEIHGTPTCEDGILAVYTLLGKSNARPDVTKGILDSLDMVTEKDGSFVITVDSAPAEGRKNHLQTKPETDHIMVRDVLGDWITQSPNALRVKRLDTPPRGPWSDEELALRAAYNLTEGVYYAYYCTQSGAGQPPNNVRAPESSGSFGGMPTQWGCKGNLDLADDDALIIRSNEAGATFRNVTLTDAFHMSIEYWSHTSSLNMIQMAADDDGDFTFVVSHRDPGIHNWLDTNGVRKPIFGCRWQAFARQGNHEKPRMTTKLVKLGDLERELSRGVTRIDSAGRKAQIARREAGFKRRFIDG